MSATREETDALGSVQVPVDALYGSATARALGNSGVSDVLLSDRPQLLVGMAWTKAAAARANASVGTIPAAIAEAIVTAAHEVAAGRWHEHFPLPVLQGGGGTAPNMNVNEVLANRATQLLREGTANADRVHPLDHVNRSQSTNDVYPTALNIAVLLAGAEAAGGLSHLIDACLAAAERVPAGLERLGRTCLQDALPVPIAAATHRMHAHGLARCRDDLLASLERLHAVPLGATAVGTGFGAPPGYGTAALAALRAESGLELVAVDDPFDALAHADPHLAVMQALNRATLVMAKMARDFRFWSSGPVGGIGELVLPAVQVGSSAMPGKINPVVPELIIQISHRVRGATTAVEARRRRRRARAERDDAGGRAGAARLPGRGRPRRPAVRRPLRRRAGVEPRGRRTQPARLADRGRRARRRERLRRQHEALPARVPPACRLTPAPGSCGC